MENRQYILNRAVFDIFAIKIIAEVDGEIEILISQLHSSENAFMLLNTELGKLHRVTESAEHG